MHKSIICSRGGPLILATAECRLILCIPTGRNHWQFNYCQLILQWSNLYAILVNKPWPAARWPMESKALYRQYHYNWNSLNTSKITHRQEILLSRANRRGILAPYTTPTGTPVVWGKARADQQKLCRLEQCNNRWCCLVSSDSHLNPLAQLNAPMWECSQRGSCGNCARLIFVW